MREIKSNLKNKSAENPCFKVLTNLFYQKILIRFYRNLFLNWSTEWIFKTPNLYNQFFGLISPFSGGDILRVN